MLFPAPRRLPLSPPGREVVRPALDTIRRVKAINRNVTGILYLNALMAFPFYSLSGRFAEANALLMDMYTGKPVELTNDEGMQ